MNSSVKTGLVFSLVWIIAKMLFFATGILGEEIVPSVMLNILCILLAISVGLYILKKKQIVPTSLLEDIKNALKAGMSYAAVVSVFIFFYYSKIDSEFNKHQISEAKIGIQKLLDEPEELQNLRDSNTEFEVMTKQDIYDSMIQGPENFYNAKSTMILSLLALLLLATLNSIFVAIIYRKIVFKDAHANLLDE